MRWPYPYPLVPAGVGAVLILALVLVLIGLSGCYSRCEAGHTICGGPYEPVFWLPS